MLRCAALVPFDPALAALHTYLGGKTLTPSCHAVLLIPAHRADSLSRSRFADCTDLHISDAVLEDGHVCRLPVLAFPG